MKIYFAGSIRGGRKDSKIYFNIIAYLESFGTVLTEHVGSKKLTIDGEFSLSDTEIFKRDILWLNTSDIVIAEVTTPSLGVGYEIGIAETLNLPILCLFNKNMINNISAMLIGNKKLICKEYSNFNNAKKQIDDFIDVYT